MSDEFHEEDSDIEKLKAWWKNYGSALVIGVVLGTSSLFGYRYWQQYQRGQAAQASAIYDQVVYHMKQKQPDLASNLGGQVMDNYDATPYAGMVALLMARMSYDRNDKTSAKQQLQWAVDNATIKATRHAARLRLAKLMGDEGKHDEALALLKTDDRGGFAAEYSELEGDLYAAKNMADVARAAYARALAAGQGQDQDYAAILQMKLADLGQKETVK